MGREFKLFREFEIFQRFSALRAEQS